MSKRWNLVLFKEHDCTYCLQQHGHHSPSWVQPGCKCTLGKSRQLSRNLEQVDSLSNSPDSPSSHCRLLEEGMWSNCGFESSFECIPGEDYGPGLFSQLLLLNNLKMVPKCLISSFLLRTKIFNSFTITVYNSFYSFFSTCIEQSCKVWITSLELKCRLQIFIWWYTATTQTEI